MSRRHCSSGTWFRVVLFALLLFAVSQAALICATKDAFAQSAEEIARRNIASFKSTFDPEMVKAAGLTQSQAEQMRKIYTFQISNDYTARRLLKTAEFTDLGKEYYRIWFQEGDGLIRQVIGKAKGRMSGYSSEVLDLIEVIQNEASRTAMKAPMDFDVGILTKTKEQAREVLEKLGGPGGVAKFHQDLQKALEEAYLEVFASLGGTPGSINAARSFISATTGWHPEAYADVKVLKKGGVASKDLVQQTVDVSKYKVSEMRKHAEHGTLTLDEAMEEAARGTAKDLEKVESVFKQIKKITGVKPQWSAEQLQMIEVMKKVEKMEMSAAEANAEIGRISGGRLDLFGGCDNLMDQMESAWKLRPKKPQELLLSIFAEFLDDADYEKSFKALLEGNAENLPASAKKVIGELEVVGKAKLLSIRGGTASEFMGDFAKDFPAYKICAKPGDESVQELIKFIESGSMGEDVAVIFGKEQMEGLRKIHELMKPELKAKIQLRYSTNKFALWELDQKGRVLLGDPGVATLGIDAGVGLAMAFWQTSTIMDQNPPLSPEEESRQILNAWGTSLPVVGDIAQGMIEGIEAYYGEDKTKYFKAGAWLAIGAAGLVPGAQAPAMVLGLTLATYEVSSSYFDIKKDKELLEAWLASGEFDKKTGKLQKLYDNKDGVHELSFEGIITNGGVPYKEVLTETTIRESVYLYAERNGLDQNEKLQSYIRALKKLYPDFPFKETLREPLTIGKPLFSATIREGGAKEPFKTVAMLMFVKAKQIADAEVNRACQGIMVQVEAEYQARHRTGDADRIFDELKALGGRLGLPLYENVNNIFDIFSNFIIEGLKTPWVRESIPRRRVLLSEKYLSGYLKIEKSLKTIRGVFERAGVNAPGFNLSGFLEVDAPRIKDLEAAYVNRAIGETGKGIQAMHRALSDDKAYVFNTNRPDPCDAELFKQLANIQVRIVEAEDRKLLLEQWTGKKSAAEASRDSSLRTAQDATKGMKTGSIVTIPAATWDSLCENYEAAYAWGNVRLEGSQVYEDAIVGQTERIEKLTKEYADAKEKGKEPMGTCLAQAPQGSIQVSNASPTEGDPASARIVLTKGQAPKGAQWTWQATVGIEIGNAAGEQTSFTAHSSGTVTVTLVMAGKTLATLQKTVTVKPKDKKDGKTDDKTKDSGQSVTAIDKAGPEILSFAGTAPDIWEGGNYVIDGYNRGFNIKRKKASSKGAGDCKWEAWVGSEIWGKINPAFAPGTEKEILSKLNEQAGTAKNGVMTTPIRPFAIGDFKGHFMDKPVKFSRGGWGDEGFRGDGVSAEGRGYVIKGEQRIELGYNVGGGGCWTNEDQPFLEAQAHAAQDDAKSILAGLQLVVNGSITKTPYNGPKLDGSDMPKVTLSPPSMEKLKIGDTVNVQTVVENAKPEDSPFSYNWSGTFDGKPEDLKKKASVKIKPSKPGKYNLSVSVNGTRFYLGSASLAYEVADYKVKIERIPPDNKPVPMGGKVRLKAVLTVDGKETTRGYIFRWQPNTEVIFSNNEVTPDTKSPGNETVATFTKTGRTKIWVEVLEPKGQISSTVATSDPIEIEVVQPKLKLVYQPKDVNVGNEVRVTVQEEPKMDDKAISFWWESTGNTINPGPALNAPNSRAYSFKPKDTRPITVTVHAKATDGGDELGVERVTINAQAYTVTISEAKYLGPPVQIWKCYTELGGASSCGFVEVKDKFAVFRDILMGADVSPKPDGQTLRYKWSVDPAGVCGQPGAGREIKIDCSETGTYTVKVEVTNADGATLGEASQPVTISISQKDMDNSKKAKEGYDNLIKAKELVSQGKLDEGIQTADVASQVDPKNKEASTIANKWKTERGKVQSSLKNMDALIAQNKIDEAGRELSEAQKLHPKYQLVVDADKRLKDAKKKSEDEIKKAGDLKKQIAEKIAKAKELVIQGKLDEGIVLIDEALKHDPHHAEATTLASKWKSEKQAVIKQVETAKQLLSGNKLAEAEKELAESQKLHPKYLPVVEAVKLLKVIQDKNKQCTALFNQALAKGKSGDHRGAIADYNKELEICPNKCGAKFNIGIAYQNLGELESALEWNESALKCGPDKDMYKNNLNKLKDKLAKINAAEDKNKQCTALFNQALAKYKGGDNRGAIEDCIKELEICPNHCGAKFNIGIAYKNLGELESALEWNESALKCDPSKDLYKNTETKIKEKLAARKAAEDKKKQEDLKQQQKEAGAQKLVNDGYTLEQQGMLSEAIVKYQKAQQIKSDNSIAQHIAKLQEILRLQEQKKKAEMDKKKQENQKEASAQKLVDDGYTLEQQGMLSEAIVKYQKAQQMKSDNSIAQHIVKLQENLRQQQKQQKKDEQQKAAQEKQKKVEMDKKKQENLKQQQKEAGAQKLVDDGYTLEQQGMMSEAIGKYQKAQQIKSDNSIAQHIANLQENLRQQQEQKKNLKATPGATIAKKPGAKSGTKPTTKPTMRQKAWVLVKTDLIAPAPADNRYTVAASASSITLGWKMDNDRFTFVSSWSPPPPAVIKPGDTVPITININVSENVGDSFFVNGSLRICFDRPEIEPGFVGNPTWLVDKDGNTGLDVSHKGAKTGETKSRVVFINSNALPGGNAASRAGLRNGDKIALLVTVFNGTKAGVRFIYQWQEIP